MPAGNSCFLREDCTEGKRVLDKFLRGKGFQPSEPRFPEVRIITVNGSPVTAQDCGYLALRECCLAQGVHLTCRPIAGLPDEQQEHVGGVPSVRILRWLAVHFVEEILADNGNGFHETVCKFLQQDVLAMQGPYTMQYLLDRWKDTTKTTGAHSPHCVPRLYVQ
jgi:hypothetical protein